MSALQHSPREEFGLTQPELFLGLPGGMPQSQLRRPEEGESCRPQPPAWPRERKEREGGGVGEERLRDVSDAGNTPCPSAGCPLLLPAPCPCVAKRRAGQNNNTRNETTPRVYDRLSPACEPTAATAGLMGKRMAVVSGKVNVFTAVGWRDYRVSPRDEEKLPFPTLEAGNDQIHCQ